MHLQESSRNVAFTVDFSDAVAQMDVWRDYVSQHMDQARDKLHSLLILPTMTHNKLPLRYVLVIGRSAKLAHHETRRLRFANYGAQRNLPS
jgi:hypothetical protein